MIMLNLQLFAKSAAYQRQRRKAKAYASGKEIEKEIKKEAEKNPAPKKKPAKGEAVSAVNLHDEYQVFVYENDKERPYTDNNGNYVYRTGDQIAKRMVYNRNRDGWESKSQIEAKQKGQINKVRKYIIRKRVR